MKSGKTRRIFCICFFLAVLMAMPAFLSAETAELLEALLTTEAVNYEQAAMLVLEAADITGYSGPSDAFRFASEQQWLPRNAAPGDQARLDGVSLLIMRSFDIQGGLFYSLAKSPHYAYREMVHQNIIQGRADPQMPVTGDLLLFMVNRVLSFQGSEDM